MGAALLLAAPLSFAQAWTGPAATYAHPLGGTISIEGPFSVWPPLNDGSGGASIRGRQVARFPGGASATFELSRAVSPAALKVGARVAARLSGPVGIGLLALDAVEWINESWQKQETQYEVTPELDPPCDYPAVPDERLTFTYVSPGKYRVKCESVTAGGTLRDYGVRDVVEHTMYVPAEDSDLENAIGSALASDPSKAGGVLQAALNHGATLDDFSPGPVEVSGPSSVPGPSTTSTHVGTAGTTTTVQNTTYNITYNDSVVTITESVSTTITHPNGDVETITEENAPPPGEGSPAEPEIADPCELHPDASGCAPLGVPGPAEALPEEERPLSFEPETVGAAGVCPEPLTTTVLGKEVKIDWSWTCDALTMLRPLVLALSWLGAIFWVFGIGRATT